MSDVMEAGLPTRMVEKPWGKDRLPAPFHAPQGRRIGEIWFEPPSELPQLLVKYIFTSEALSVQVHPTDDQAEAAGKGRRGKDECWLIVAADPGAKIGIGFNRHVGAEEMRAAAQDGSIEGMIRWYEVEAGDFFYIPANTVHAIGAGCSLIETQQNSDITYRLYDYGRPRELHLDQGVAVASGEPYPEALHRKLPAQGNARLVSGPFFRLDRVAGAPDKAIAERYGTESLLVIPLEGHVRLPEGPLHPGSGGVAPGVEAIDFSASRLCLLAQPCRR